MRIAVSMPNAINAYNTYMEGVDLLDNILS